ncbi:hypothetical protein JS532_08440 [Bifidobacterium callimiconis]|uniref:hypothetical protein n=1 Tax=Bifidobacterium callimiconis TaxID=2306973 RepID=UPI001BDCF984|nr:hypothetical protein [Bifidobacterium callimiconis]MBT1177588.1 hypothetical protein [Bifidobacterium callimiconis]
MTSDLHIVKPSDGLAADLDEASRRLLPRTLRFAIAGNDNRTHTALIICTRNAPTATHCQEIATIHALSAATTDVFTMGAVTALAGYARLLGNGKR